MRNCEASIRHCAVHTNLSATGKSAAYLSMARHVLYRLSANDYVNGSAKRVSVDRGFARPRDRPILPKYIGYKSSLSSCCALVSRDRDKAQERQRVLRKGFEDGQLLSLVCVKVLGLVGLASGQLLGRVERVTLCYCTCNGKG